ncbi:peptide ABC transporter substrate-binding protein [Edwardsiella piscicida]|uniref:peptide ABC transporter substrate-binding protein n=1 Tax=Edwardsiella piscicida TaxID=1263550 RepID=UPI00084C51F4|nr:peptide ABC transporter substrate-binding protein [Edwardsiella piscicida]EKS7767096.1 peptide ABC transporter substrate-binding protein [Edwardsiella piscicida]EKS7792971.1 peptide ABC transporter substrate-binding protein [Edwardsiella piscicida]EKS7814083.1 peptide ABC transporter substrate-binding protein [Edwardsiella piscicida]ELM3727945.1 peptide ABC transporter substrate-binding protein [Edwardsiella piscicida]ELV7534829.1 peptide ABC transporter substrate-binding protein [Edwardsie
MQLFRLAAAAAIGVVVSNGALAAQVPPGTVLAETQSVVRHLKDEPVSLDPVAAVGLTEAQVLRDLFEGLVNQGPDGSVQPGVASAWQSKDQQRYVFQLRDTARWSNGDAVTAYDFVYAWRRLVDPQTHSPFAWFAETAGIANAAEIVSGQLPPDRLGVTAPDARTLVVQLNRPLPYFPQLCAHFSLFPQPQKVVERYGQAWTRPGNLVGNGAFQLAQRVVNEHIVLTPNPYYWDHAQTRLTRVTFVPINQESAATKRYLAGDLDITESFPKNMYQALKKRIPDEVFTPVQLGTYYYAFNTRRAPLNDARVRRALSYAIDREIIAGKVVGSGEKPAYRLTPDVTDGVVPQPLPMQRMSQAERNRQARAWLREAGYGPSRPLRLTLLYNTAENHQKIAIAVASMWKKSLGVQVKLTNQEWKTYVDSRNSGQFDVVRASWIADYNEASSFLGLLGSRHSGNLSGFSQPAYDALLQQAAREGNGQTRSAIYQQAERMLAEEAPIAPLYQYTNARLIKPWVKGYPINNPEDVAYSHQLYILQH